MNAYVSIPPVLTAGSEGVLITPARVNTLHLISDTKNLGEFFGAAYR